MDYKKRTATTKPLKHFLVSFKWYFNSGDYIQKETICAESASKARYEFFYSNLSESWEYKDVFDRIKSRVIKQPDKSDFYEKINPETLKYRNIEFVHLGMNVEFCGRKGFVIGTNQSCNLTIMSHDFTKRWCNHPHWKMKYFNNDGNLIKEYGDNNG